MSVQNNNVKLTHNKLFLVVTHIIGNFVISYKKSVQSTNSSNIKNNNTKITLYTPTSVSIL